MQREIDPNSSASRTRRYEGSASYFFFPFFFELLLAARSPKRRKNPHPCKNRKDAAHSVVWLWRELTSCALRMPCCER
jgi:hypothetical protein